MTKTQLDRQHQMTARLRRELDVAEGLRRLNEYRRHPAYHGPHGHGGVKCGR